MITEVQRQVWGLKYPIKDLEFKTESFNSLLGYTYVANLYDQLVKGEKLESQYLVLAGNTDTGNEIFNILVSALIDNQALQGRALRVSALGALPDDTYNCDLILIDNFDTGLLSGFELRNLVNFILENCYFSARLTIINLPTVKVGNLPDSLYPLIKGNKVIGLKP